MESFGGQRVRIITSAGYVLCIEGSTQYEL